MQRRVSAKHHATNQTGARHSPVPGAVAFVSAALSSQHRRGAALYKWTDANGRVVYSDQPPAGDVKVDTVAGPPPPANPTP